jgi:hypothetical protein
MARVRAVELAAYTITLLFLYLEKIDRAALQPQTSKTFV